MLADICRQLASFDERVWARYAYAREPLRGKLSFGTYLTDFWPRAVAEGRAIAADCAGRSPRDIAEALGVTVTGRELEPGAPLSAFALFTEPDRIEICETVARETQELLGAVEDPRYRFDVADVLLAHEVFHALQSRYPRSFLHQKHITLWKVLSLENRSRLVSLEEVAAMAFARELLALAISPYALDVLMSLLRAPEQAREIYRRLIQYEEELSRG